MKARFAEQKNLLKCWTIPPVGNFALEACNDKAIVWDHCREQFAAKFNSVTSGFYFSHPENRGHDVAEFITKFELIVAANRAKSFNTSIFRKTCKNSIIWIEPSFFWIDCLIKRSLLTILLRCGINYDMSLDNFDDALFGEYKESEYVRETRSATLRFLFGFTKFNGPVHNVANYASVQKHGWREEFQNLDDCSIRRRLILPEGELHEISIVGMESLWT